jgi:hypothetical protein
MTPLAYTVQEIVAVECQDLVSMQVLSSKCTRPHRLDRSHSASMPKRSDRAQAVFSRWADKRQSRPSSSYRITIHPTRRSITISQVRERDTKRYKHNHEVKKLPEKKGGS